MSKILIQSAYDALVERQPLDDEELFELKEHFQELVELCRDLGPIFYLPFCEASKRITEIDKILLERDL